MAPAAFVRQPARWLNAITKYQVTHSGGPNFGYDLCIRDIKANEIEAVNLSSWKVAINGGENVRSETLEEFSNKFKKYGFNPKQLCPAYGMSELTGAIAVKSYAKSPRVFKLAADKLKDNLIQQVSENIPHSTFVSSGNLLTGLQAAIVNPITLLSANENEIGEVWLSGKSLSSGYWRKEEESKATFGAKLPESTRTYFRTGDLGFMFENELCLTGRLKDLIVLHGKKYYPADLEMTVSKELKRFPVGQYNIAFTTAIEAQENIIILQEIPEKTTADNQRKIIESIRHCIARDYQLDIYAIILVKENSLPKTPSGKLKRKECKLQFEQEKLAIITKQLKTKYKVNEKPPSKMGMEADFIKLVASVLSIDSSQIDLTQPLSQYGFDSISLIRLAALLNETYQLGITPAVLFEYTTLAEFYAKYANALNTKQISKIQPQTHTNDIAVIGMSGIFPAAPDIETFWNNMIAGKNAIKEIPDSRWNWQEYYGDPLLDGTKTNVKWGGFIDNIDEFDAHFFNISPREAELIDPQQRIFLQTTWKAIEDAGYTTKALSQLKTGLFVGAFTNDYAELLQKNQITDPYITTGLTHSILANRISYLLDLHGPSEAIDTACSSSLVAIHHAVRAIQNGDCDVAIAGGVNALLSPTSYLSAGKAGMLSEDGSCKTFDKKANGYVRGEGAAAILLKPLAQAQRDGDHIYGVIKGTAINHGGHVSSLTVPNPVAQADVITTACQRAQIHIESISYIEAHGTGTSLGDPIEINGLKKAFAMLEGVNNKNYCGVGSVKTHIGHLEAAAGIAGVIKVLLSMQHTTLPGNLHFDELNPYIELAKSPFYIVNQTKEWGKLREDIPRRAGISSFGFGGTNAHIIIEESSASIADNVSFKEKPYLIAFSGKTKEALHQRISDLYHWLSKQTRKPSLAKVSFTLNTGRNHFNERYMVIVKSIEELQTVLQQSLAENFSNNSDIIDKSTMAESVDLLLNELTENHDSNILSALGHLYIQGANINWEKLYYDERKRIALPTYPFAKDHYWIPSAQQNIQENDIIIAIDNVENYLPHVQQDIIKFVSEIIKVSLQKINLTQSLSDQGFDSISFGELAVDLEKHYKIELKPTIFYSYNSINDLSNHLLNTYPTELSKRYQQNEQIFIPPAKSIVSKPPVATTPTAQLPLPSSEAIAIIGMQGMFPQSNNINEFWAHLIAGDDLVTEIPLERWDWHDNFGDAKNNSAKTNSKWGGFISDIDKFDAGFFNISTREANLMDPQQRLMLETVWKTIEDAGYDPHSFSGLETGLFVGMGFCDYQALISKQQKIFHGHLATGNSYAMMANRISYFLNLHGPSEVVDTACSSSLVAINRAVSALRSGECSVAIAGGVSIILNPDIYVITSQLGALSADGKCKTFDKAANGFVKGEGVAAILLKPLTQAQRDGDHIYAVIRGSAVNHGGKAQSLTAPNPEAQSQLLIKAYTQAGVDTETISYIEAHGTGTELGDPIEIEGLKIAFKKLGTAKNSQHYCGLGSVKSNIGHLEPASGIAGLIKVLLAMQHKQIPQSLHINHVNPLIDLKDSPFYLVNKTQSWSRLKDVSGNDIPLRAGVSSFGFGGTNSHVVVEEAPSRLVANNNKLKPYYLLTLSARDEGGLTRKITELYDWMKVNSSNADLESICFTLNIGRTHFDYRCAIVISSLDELLSSLKALINNQQISNCVMNSASVTNIYQPLFKEICNVSLAAIKSYSTTAPQIYKDKLLLLADLYTRHYSFDLNQIHLDEKRQRVAMLPSYPFNKQRYWFDAELPSIHSQPKVNNLNAFTHDLSIFTLHYLKDIFAEKLKIPSQQIVTDVTYEAYGVDSLLGLEITKRLEDDFGTLSKTLLYEKNRLIDLANYLQNRYTAILQRLANINVLHGEVNVDVKPFPSIIPDLANSSDDIAIIGLTGIYPKANNINEFWDNLLKSTDCVTEIPADRWNYKDYPVTVGGEEKYYKHGGFIADVDKFDPLFFNIAPRDANLMDPQERLFMQSAWDVLEDAGYTRETLQNTVNNSVGVFVGVTYNYYPLFIAEEWSKGNRLPLDLQLFSIANRVSYFLNLNGPSTVIDTACSSSLAAVHSACESIIRGDCKMAIAGGVNLSLHPSKYHMLGSYSFMSDKGQCASFAADGAGYVPSEGVGSVLLKPLSQAINDNDHIYGVIKSSSINHGGKTSGYTVPNPNAHTALIKNALIKSRINPRTISYVEAHGTGTALGDPIEIRGLQDAFAEYTQDKQFCAIGSVKSNIGHLEAAAGISQLTKVLMQMQHKKLVPSIHSETLNPYIDFSQTAFFVQKQLSNWIPENNNSRRAGISSFGAGGTNVHLIVEEHIPANIHQPVLQHPHIFLLSALNTERLQEYINKMYRYLKAERATYSSEIELNDWLSRICYTLQVGREHMSTRLAMRANSYEELVNQIQTYRENSSSNIAKMTPTDDIDQLIQYWLDGNKVNWKDIYKGQLPTRISLPTYPFAKRRCWIPTQQISMPVQQNEIQEQWLIFSDTESGLHLQNELGKSSCIYCFIDTEFTEFSPNIFYINPNNPEYYSKLINKLLVERNIIIKGIIYLWPIEFITNIYNMITQQLSDELLLTVISRSTDNKIDDYLSNQKPGGTLTLTLNENNSLSERAKSIADEIKQFKFEKNTAVIPAPELKIISVQIDNNDQIIEILYKILAKLLALEVSEIELETPFQNYGLDSIIGINFVAELNEQYADLVTPMDLYRYPTVSQLAAYIAENHSVTQPGSSLDIDFQDDEEKFMEDIAHLNDEEVSRLLEKELMELDEVI